MRAYEKQRLIVMSEIVTSEKYGAYFNFWQEPLCVLPKQSWD